MSADHSLQVTRDGRVVTLSFNRPSRRNAIDLELVTALRAALSEVTDGAVVIASAHPGMFCAGADLSISSDERAEVSRSLYALYAQMIDLPIPLLAALDGAAVGGGAQLAVACDLRLASPKASVRFVGPGHGLAVGAWALPALVGRGRAIDLCLTGRRVPAEDGLAMGLVDRVCTDVLAAAQALAAQLAELDRDAVARVKSIVTCGLAPSAALALEAAGNEAWAGEARRA